MVLLTVDFVNSLDKECKNWLKDPSVRFVKVINKTGKPVAGSFKHGVFPHLRDEKIRSMYIQLMLEFTMRKEYDEMLGDTDYIVAKRQNATILSIPMKDYLIIFSLNTHVEPRLIAKKAASNFKQLFQDEGYKDTRKLQEA